MKSWNKVVLGSLAALPLAANAALDTDVTAALTAGATDAGLIYAGLLAVALVGVTFLMGIKGVKKIPRAM